jgi:HNH endonuclease
MRWRRHGDPKRGGPVANRALAEICSVEGCTRQSVARDLCDPHYRRWKRCGDATGGRPTPGAQSVESRFWSKVNQTPDCWLWTDRPNSNGYGTFSINGSARTLAHRYAWILAGLVLDPAMTLDHLCRNRMCVRVTHLEQVSLAENLARARVVDEDACAISAY